MPVLFAVGELTVLADFDQRLGTNGQGVIARWRKADQRSTYRTARAGFSIFSEGIGIAIAVIA